MIDVLLIQPPIRDFYFTKKRSIPYGLASLAASLEQNGLTVEVFDALASSKTRLLETPENLSYLETVYGPRDYSSFALFHDYKHFGYSFQTIESVIKQTRAPVIGIASMFTPYSEMAAAVARLAKKVSPASKTVLGGHHATTLPESVLGSLDVDFVIRGEGDIALPLLVKRLKENGRLDDIPGLTYRLPDGSVHQCPRAIVEDLEALPPPTYQVVKQSFYQRKRQGCGVIVASRGCPMNCSYCSVGRSSEVPYRRRSVESVLDEIEVLVSEFNVRFIDFEDENLTLSRDWTRQLLTGIIQRFGTQGLELRAMNGLMPSTLDEETIELMSAAGFKALNLSLCTLSIDQLHRFCRSNQKEAYEAVLRVAKRLSMDIVTYIIVGAPFQKAIESLTDLIYLAIKNTIVGVSVYYPSPGSSDYLMCESEGLIPESDMLTRSSAIPISHSTSRLESVTLLRLGRILNFLKSIFPEFGLKKAAEPNVINRKSARETDEIDLDLLKVFFGDGILLGIDEDGRKFELPVDLTLVSRFRDEVLSILPKDAF